MPPPPVGRPGLPPLPRASPGAESRDFPLSTEELAALVRTTARALQQLQAVLGEWERRGILPGDPPIVSSLVRNRVWKTLRSMLGAMPARERKLAVVIIGSFLLCVVAITAGLSCGHGP